MLVETRLGRLWVDARGEGTAVVLWPSFLTDGGMWRYVAPVLAERHRVLTIDPPGHGRSARIERRFTLEECAEAVVDLLDAQKIERAHFAGLSWGGMTGMRLALSHPERLRSLAILDSSADREARRKLPSYRAMALIARVAGPDVPRLLDRIEPLYFAPRTRRERPDLVRDFRDHVSRMDPVSLIRCADAIVFQRRDIRDRLPAIRVPSLVIVGAEDIATPPRCSRDIADRIPGAAMLQIADAGHLAALEQPDRINDELLRLFARAEA